MTHVSKLGHFESWAFPEETAEPFRQTLENPVENPLEKSKSSPQGCSTVRRQGLFTDFCPWSLDRSRTRRRRPRGAQAGHCQGCRTPEDRPMAASPAPRQGFASASSIGGSEQLELVAPLLPELNGDAAGALLKLLRKGSDSRTRENECLPDSDPNGYARE